MVIGIPLWATILCGSSSTSTQDVCLSTTRELEAQALAILDSLVSTPFDQCIPITRAFKNVTASSSIYAVRHRELGLLYVGKTRYGSGFESEYLYRLPFRLALLASALLLPAGFYGLRLASQNNPGYLPLAAIPITFRVQQACEG